MLSSSKSDTKQEARFAARLDVLLERVDTLAATVATTASAMAKKDGEIASLRRDLQARDGTLQELAAQARLTSQTPAGGTAPDVNELRSLRNAVAALTKEHAQGGSASQVGDLATRVQALGQRLEALSTTVSTTSAAIEADHGVTQRVDDLEAELASLKALAERRSTEPERPSEELRAMLTTLRSQVEALGGLASGVSEGQLEERFTETAAALARLSQRMDSLAATVESAAASLGDKEHELAALQRHFAESSTRIESIVDDIREALSAFPELGSDSIEDLATRIERVETTTRKATETNGRTAGELAGRIDVIDQRVAAVAAEVARAKTLWPVALRSLEARLDDAVHAHRPEPTVPKDTATPDVPDEPADDLLAGLRDSLEAMETVAAEMARASDTLSGADDEAAAAPAAEPPEELAPVAAVGATIVPLRTGDP